MKITLERIRKANVVFAFLAFVVLAAYLLVQGISFIIRHLPKPDKPGVQIIPVERAAEITQTLRFNAVLKDTYVFTLESDAVVEPSSARMEMNAPALKRVRYDQEVVNMYFVSSDTKKESSLLTDNALIVSYGLANDEKDRGLITEQNFYAIVSADSNGDKRLSAEDAVGLFVSNYNGTELTQIGKDVYSCRLVKNNILLFTEADGTATVFKVYDENRRRVEEIKRDSRPPENKAFGQIMF